MSLSITDQMRCLQWLWEHRTESVDTWNQRPPGEAAAMNKWGPRVLREWRFYDFWADWVMGPDGLVRCYRGAIVDAEAVRDEMVRLDALLHEDEKWARTWR